MNPQPPPISPSTQNATQKQAGVYAKTMKLYNEMKIAVFTFILLKIFMVQFSLVFVNEEEYIDLWNTIETFFVSFFGSVLVIVTFGLFLYETYKQTKVEKETNVAIVATVADFLMLLANYCYFIGDNITNFYTIQSKNASRYRYVSQYLLVIGLAGFFFVPRLKKTVQKYYTKNDNEDMVKVQNFTSNAIAMILEIDAFYTILTNTELECRTYFYGV